MPILFTAEILSHFNSLSHVSRSYQIIPMLSRHSFISLRLVMILWCFELMLALALSAVTPLLSADVFPHTMFCFCLQSELIMDRLCVKVKL